MSESVSSLGGWMNWQQVVRRDDIVGGDLEEQSSGKVARGPIVAIRLEGTILRIETEWLGIMEPGKTGWELHKMERSESLMINVVAIPPTDIGDGRISFFIPDFPPGTGGICTIFPKGGSKLDPANVKGLVVPS